MFRKAVKRALFTSIGLKKAKEPHAYKRAVFIETEPPSYKRAVFIQKSRIHTKEPHSEPYACIAKSVCSEKTTKTYSGRKTFKPRRDKRVRNTSSSDLCWFEFGVWGLW